MSIKRYTADELHGDLFYTLPDGAEFVSAADCEALEAELARVKAESLCVVPVGEACQPHELYPTQFILRDNRVWVNAPGTRDIVDITNNNRVSVPYDEIVQPVRLERWEARP